MTSGRVARFAVAVPFAVAGAFGQPGESQPHDLFARIGLTSQQIAAIDAGRPVAKVLTWGGPSEVYVFGAVHVNASPAAYMKTVRDVGRLANLPGYIGVGELPATVTGADLSGLTIDDDDIKALKACREGACDVQLPTASILAFQSAVNWSQPDAACQASGLARGMVLDLVREYRRGGNTALGVFHTALDVSVCVGDTAKSRRSGFYLITLKSSEQDGLTGVKGSALRKIVVDKTRSSLETALGAIKQSLEQTASSSSR